MLIILPLQPFILFDNLIHFFFRKEPPFQIVNSVFLTCILFFQIIQLICHLNERLLINMLVPSIHVMAKSSIIPSTRSTSAVIWHILIVGPPIPNLPIRRTWWRSRPRRSHPSGSGIDSSPAPSEANLLQLSFRSVGSILILILLQRVIFILIFNIHTICAILSFKIHIGCSHQIIFNCFDLLLTKYNALKATQTTD